MAKKKEKKIGNEKYRFYSVPEINLFDEATAAVESLVAHKMFTNSPLRRLLKDTSDKGKKLASEYEELRKKDISNSVVDILEKVFKITGSEFPFKGKEKEEINIVMKKALIYEMIQCLELKDVTTSTEAQGDLIYSLITRLDKYKPGE